MENEELYTVALSEIIAEFSLTEHYLPKPASEIMISCPRVNRPGLPLCGFYDHYENFRIQIIGKVEHLYLSQLEPDLRTQSLRRFFASQPVAVVVTTSLPISCETRALA